MSKNGLHWEVNWRTAGRRQCSGCLASGSAWFDVPGYASDCLTEKPNLGTTQPLRFDVAQETTFSSVRYGLCYIFSSCSPPF